ncbi:embryonic protein UVS.2-like [Dendropsophus ebraccatus]|uniref:embryonic protein UVS.2-like n=1 Tax=Dendropsophus ebraccatus TaxID=150705 RepID=UPI00383120C1
MGEKMHLLALLLFALGPVTSVPVLPPLQRSMTGLKEYDIKNAEEPQGILSRIIKVNKEKKLALLQGDILIKPGRSAVKCNGSCFWPKSADGMVLLPYSFGSKYNNQENNLFKTSMDEYEALTCVRLVPRTTEKDYLNIVSSKGCVAYVGRLGEGQMLGVDSNGCMYRGIIQHEINHALGFYHEHMRSDRDDYVTIRYQYISAADRGNFNKADSNNLGLEYDYGSVMHYDKYEFTNTTGQPTIMPKPNPNVPIGQRVGISPLDVAKINRLYQCDVCATLLNEKSGILKSANYPSAYPHNANCVWLIRTPSNQVSLNFIAFDVQSSPNCTSDYIRIYDGPTKNYQMLLDRTCGTGLIPPIIASTNQLLVEFSSDSKDAGLGFRALYGSVKCGGTFYASRATFTSPGYPNAYGPNLNCVYEIKAPAEKKITMTFSDFSTEDAPSCSYDYVKILDGSTTIGQFCGESKIADITSTTNNVKLTFVSDELFEKKGFKASYTFHN